MSNKEVAEEILKHIVISSVWRNGERVRCFFQSKKCHDGVNGAIQERAELVDEIVKVLDKRDSCQGWTLTGM